MHKEKTFVASVLFFYYLVQISTNSEVSRKDRIREKLENEEELEQWPSKGPLTPVGSSETRQLIPNRIIPDKTPCTYLKYRQLYRIAIQLEMGTVDVILEATTNISDQYYYLYDPEDMCLVVEDDLTVDQHRYDCHPDDVCVCGIDYGRVDPHIPQPHPEHNFRTYTIIKGLDRKLVAEDGECVSGHKGHCTLANTQVTQQISCKRSLQCTRDDSYGQILKNLVNNYEYGICLPKPSSVPSADNMIAYETLGGPSPTNISAANVLILVFIIFENIDFTNN